MAEPRLSLADQVLANALAFLAVRLISDPRREDLMIAEIREAVALASAHPQAQRLAKAARVYLAVIDEAPHDLRHRSLASTHIATPVADFLFWRAGLARDALVQSGAALPPGGSDEGRHAAQ